MKTDNPPEYWLRGPVPGVPDLLQPVAHALLQAQEEMHDMMSNVADRQLWERPAGVASAGFHLRHLAGVLDRLFTYARGEALSQRQLAYLAEEGNPQEDITVAFLLDVLDAQLAKSLDQLRATDPQTLTQTRTVGRLQLPSTVMGLLFHAAEHTMRHTGQLLVTVRVLLGGKA
ncbi:MAG TPA: DinB family protein [Chitinophagaceae bacterium]|nr:DinB family protein [Chitinophagaceae bacterium]